MVIMNNIDLIYTNGCSFTAGGGLEPPDTRHNSVMNYYVDTHNVKPWKHEKEISWPQRVSDILGISVTNEAASGGGLARVIRMTYDFILKHWDMKDKLLLLLDIPYGLRLDVYYKPLDSYLIVNYNDSGGSKHSKYYGTTGYYRESEEEKNIETQKTKDIDFYGDTFLNLLDFEKNEHNNLMGLVSYCLHHDINIKLISHDYFSNRLDQNLFINEYPYNYCIERKLIIRDETNLSTDTHPGYFGHKEYGQYVVNQLVYKGMIDDKYLDENLTSKIETDTI